MDIQGLLGNLRGAGQKVRGLLDNPMVQGGLMAAATGFNPLIGLLAGPAIKNDRERRELELDALRDEVSGRKDRRSAQGEITGLLADTTPVIGPDRFIEGIGEDIAIPGRMQQVPATATPQGQERMMGLLARAAPEQFTSQMTSGLMGQMFPQERPNSLDAKLGVVEDRLGRKLTNDEVLKLSGGGTTINVGGESKLDEPIPITNLDSIMLPGNKPAPLGMTFRQAQAAGATVVSTADKATMQQAESAMAILDELEALAVGPDGIFTNIDSGAANRGAAALDFAMEAITQDDPRVARFKDLSHGTVAAFVKMMGEKGALAEGDVSRALGLLPRIFPIPDTGEVAEDKIKDLRGIISRGARNLNSGTQAEQTNRRFRFNPATGQLEPVE